MSGRAPHNIWHAYNAVVDAARAPVRLHLQGLKPFAWLQWPGEEQRHSHDRVSLGFGSLKRTRTGEDA